MTCNLLLVDDHSLIRAGVRALVLADRLTESEAPAYLSGILIGHEVRAALGQAGGAVVQVIGASDLTAYYALGPRPCSPSPLES